MKKQIHSFFKLTVKAPTFWKMMPYDETVNHNKAVSYNYAKEWNWILKGKDVGPNIMSCN